MKNSKDKYINSLVSKLINETLNEKADSLVSKIKSSVDEDLGGMEDSHPRFGKLNFSDYTSDEIKNMLRKPMIEPMDITVDDEEGFDDEDDMIYVPKRRKSSFEDDEEDYESYENMYEELEEGMGMACESCGGTLSEGECTECGWSKTSMDENIHQDTKFRPAGSSFDYVQEEDMEDEEGVDQDMSSAYDERVSRFCDTESEDYHEESCNYLKNDFLTEEMKEALHGKQRKLDKNKNNKIDSEDFKMLRKGKKETKESNKPDFLDLDKDGNKKESMKSAAKDVKSKVAESLQLTEDELVSLIEKIIKEDKKTNFKKSNTRGLDVYQKAHTGSGKENNEYLKSVAKKMKEYLKDGSKGQYDTNPEIFPKGNGELAKMSKKAYHVSKDGEEFLDDYMRPGMENLDYDEVHPNEDWMKDNIEGSSRTGNNPGWGNAEKTDLGAKLNKKRKENKFAKARRMAANKSAQPVVSDKPGQESGKGLNIKLESTENKKNELLSEEFNRMKNLIGYDRKTQ
jgi:hypothetical protein